MPGLYFSDEEHLKKWLEMEEDEDLLEKFLFEYIYSTKNFGEYLEKCGGMKRLEELRKQELLE
ncbi:MAG: hypothetical protein FJW69_06405 [Actinobacteria bacterium]|nr:hypothetical protein [Actinomycetota bacterium]